MLLTGPTPLPRCAWELILGGGRKKKEDPYSDALTLFSYLDGITPRTQSSQHNIIIPKTKFMLLKQYILEKVANTMISPTEEKITMIKNYLDIRIDDYSGVLTKKYFSINLDVFINFTDMNVGNQEILRSHFINDTHKHFTRDVDYVVHQHSNMQLKNRLRGAPQDKRYNMIHINIDTFIQLLFESQTQVSTIICEYFIIMENLQLDYMRQDVCARRGDGKKLIKRVMDIVQKKIKLSFSDVEFFSVCAYGVMNDVCHINLRDVFMMTKRTGEFQVFKSHFLRFLTLSNNVLDHAIDGKQQALLYEKHKDTVFINNNSLKYWLMCFDGQNQNVYHLRKYFITMEHLAIKTMQKEFMSEQNKITIDYLRDQRLCDIDNKSSQSCCYFYILILDDDVFKYGITTSPRLRQAAYNVGRLRQVEFLCLVRIQLDDDKNKCKKFEYLFGREFDQYRMKGQQEIIHINRNILMAKLDLVLRRRI